MPTPCMRTGLNPRVTNIGSLAPDRPQTWKSDSGYVLDYAGARILRPLKRLGVANNVLQRTSLSDVLSDWDTHHIGEFH